jgi:putative mRNA 3-end processing factor
LPFGQKIQLGEVTVSLHPAGHILGSAQVRVEHEGQVWVASGDYKREFDPSCEPFEVVNCDTYITEATFGTPKYRWKKKASHGNDIFHWWQENSSRGHASVLLGYSLGKTQRILAELYPFAQRPIFIHPAAAALTECYRMQGVNLAETRILPKLTEEPQLFKTEKWSEELIIAPPGWIQTFSSLDKVLGPFNQAFASGWVQGADQGNPPTHRKN